MDTLLRDIRHGAGRLRRDRLLTATAVISLAIGLGATTAIYTVTRAVLHRPQPGIVAPGSVVDIGRTRGGHGFNPLSYPDYLELRIRSTRVEQIYAYTMFPQAMSLSSGRGMPDRIFATTVSANYFVALGVVPAAGRLFQPTDGEGLGASPSLVISDESWERVFKRRTDIAGRPVTVDGRAFTVIGVAPRGFHGSGLRRADAWVLIGAIRGADTPTLLAARDAAWLMVGGRLTPGVTRDAANAELAVIGRTLPSSAGQPDRGLQAMALSPVAGGAGPLTAFFVALFVIVGAVLSVACANVAGMLLSRAPMRRREMAVRAALGATRSRLALQLMSETLVLFVAGAAVGLMVDWMLTRVILVSLPALPFPIDLSLPVDTGAIAFTAATTFITAMLSGFAPALGASRVDLSAAMRPDTRPHERMRLRRAFVVTQVAISVVVVIVGALFLRSLQNAGALNPGFDPRGVDLVTVNLTNTPDQSTTSVLSTLLARVGTIPAVQTVSASLSFPGGFEEFRLGALTRPGMTEPLNGDWNVVAPGYFATIRMPLLAGRDFSVADRSGSLPVAILGEGAVRRLWPGGTRADAVGAVVDLQRYRPGGGFDRVALTVIGIVGDPAYGTLVDGATDFHPYVPFAQQPMPRMMLVARTRNGSSALNQIQEAVAAVGPELTIAAAQLAEEYSALGLLPQRVGASVTAGLGLVGVFLAGVGVFGVTAHAVARRTREVGIRIALGASLGSVARLILREGMLLVVIGALVGLGLGIGAAQFVAGYLAGLPPLDPIAFGSAAVLFMVSGLAACALPMRRALQIRPVEALRES
jgi:predicted permease